MASASLQRPEYRINLELAPKLFKNFRYYAMIIFIQEENFSSLKYTNDRKPSVNKTMRLLSISSLSFVNEALSMKNSPEKLMWCLWVKLS